MAENKSNQKADSKKGEGTIEKIKDSAVKIAGNVENVIKDPEVVNAGKTIGNKIMDAFKKK